MGTKSAEEFVNKLLSKEPTEQPSDRVKPDELVIKLPEWYDKKQFDRGREFFQEFCFAFPVSMLMGLVAVFAIPSILKVLMNTRRSNSPYTAYRRYLSTMLHTISWFDHELKPGTVSWRSLETVRSRHLRASMASQSKGVGIVSQRDIALTQFGFIGYALLKPDKFGIRQQKEGDWEAYNHFWKVIGHMIGLEDRYNICQPTVEETREVCRLLLERVFTPCLETVPEYFEHLARVMLDGMWSVNPTIDVESCLYWSRHLSDVPGYIYTEEDRINLQRKLWKLSEGKSLDAGVEVTKLISKPAIEGLPDVPPRKLYYNDYNSIDTAPEYKNLTFKSKYKMYFNNLYVTLYTSYIGKWYFNLNFRFSMFLMKYFPYLAFYRFGIKESLVNMFEEDPKDDVKPKINKEYNKIKKEQKWYHILLDIIW